MKTVRVYYAGIPAKNTKPEKRDVLHNFHVGVPQGQSKEIEQARWEPSDLAVIQGWVHQQSQKSPHLRFRKEVIDKQKEIGKHTLAIDSNLFLYVEPTNKQHYLRFSLNDVFPTTGTYFTDNVDPSRWTKIQKNLNIQVKPWRTQGQHILICLQRNGGWSMGGLDVMEWCNNIIKTLIRLSDRPIVVRAHPGDRRAQQYLKINHPQVRISNAKTIQHDLSGAWACITYNSSPGVASAIEGVPVFVTDPNPRISQAFDVANKDLTLIESPRIFDRQAWLEKLAMCHFNYEDLKQGTAWNIIKEYL